ncbi:unnamed protein product [Rotaria sordida]|uniref:glycerophosphodiester phosphodiesterase n=1 Tax=Rotaria sordida TaxID=392033 RepID=A0A819YX16_9BILA|nr:unnamed protein product [Rotaria sordida]
MLSFLLFLYIFEICQCLQRPIVIAHRGTAYLPELTLASQSMAHAYGADIIEIDVCLSRDNQLIVIHDIHLDGITNVSDIFPNRNRSDVLNHRVQPLNGTQVYPLRFPSKSKVRFYLSTLNETIELLFGLNRATGRQRQLLIEIKKPEYHSKYNKSISSIVLATLNAYNLTRSSDPIIVQTFYIEELMYIRKKLGSQLRLLALMTWNYIQESSSDYNFYRSEEGLAPNHQLVVNYDPNGAITGTTNLTKWAHQYNFSVYPFTFRQDLFSSNSFEELVKYFWHTVQVDGFITDHPDVIL